MVLVVLEVAALKGHPGEQRGLLGGGGDGVGGEGGDEGPEGLGRGRALGGEGGAGAGGGGRGDGEELGDWVALAAREAGGRRMCGGMVGEYGEGGGGEERREQHWTAVPGLFDLEATEVAAPWGLSRIGGGRLVRVNLCFVDEVDILVGFRQCWTCTKPKERMCVVWGR